MAEIISQTLNLVLENSLEMTFSLITHHVPGKWQHCQADSNRKTENSLGRWIPEKIPVFTQGRMARAQRGAGATLMWTDHFCSGAAASNGWRHLPSHPADTQRELLVVSSLVKPRQAQPGQVIYLCLLSELQSVQRRWLLELGGSPVTTQAKSKVGGLPLADSCASQ